MDKPPTDWDEHSKSATTVTRKDFLRATVLGFVIMVGSFCAIALDGRPFNLLTRKLVYGVPLTLGWGMFMVGLLMLYAKHVERRIHLRKMRDRSNR